MTNAEVEDQADRILEKEIDPDIYHSGTHVIKCHLAKSMEEDDSHVRRVA